MNGSVLGRRASHLPYGTGLLALVGLALGGLVAAPGRAEPGGPPPPAGPAPAGSQELILFTTDGPVRVRLTVTLGGETAAGPWRTALDALFAHCDRDGDGTLSDKEREVFQVPRTAINEFVLIDGTAYVSPRPPAVAFPVRDGRVDRAGFRAGFAAADLGPVSVTPVAARDDSRALTDALFKLLDRDGDGKLSAAELKAARSRLAALDADEDEIVSAAELLGRPQNPQYQLNVAVTDLDVVTAYGARQNGGHGQPVLPDVLVPPVGQPVGVKDVLAARDANKDGVLSPAELGCDAGALAALDADGDGRLDRDELAAWLRQPQDLDLAFDLPAPAARSWLPIPSRRPAATGTVRLVGRGRLAGQVKPDGGEDLRAVLPSVRVRFVADGGAERDALRQWQNSAENLRTAFALVAGTRGAVERKQLAENPELAGALTLFDFADRDRNGKVTADELDTVIRTGGALVYCRAAVEIADLGRGLFELLDRNGDGRLSPRELNAAAGLLAGLDRDEDGKLARTEIPRGYTVTAKPASVPLTATGVAQEGTVLFAGPGRTTRQGGTGSLPEWFRHADRNEDGDVSAREFPGPPDLFKRIDTDGDGLISPEEALAFERLMSGKPR